MEAQRWRQHPHEFGRAATYVETVDRPDLTELAARFLKEINYYGLAEIEFKRDRGMASTKLLDVNARTWGFHVLGFTAGVDFPISSMRINLGQSFKPLRGRAVSAGSVCDRHSIMPAALCGRYLGMARLQAIDTKLRS